MLAALLVAEAAPRPAFAAEADAAPGGVLRLQEALDRALASNRQLAAFEFRVAEHSGHREQAGLPPNPELQLEIENFGGGRPFDGFESADATLSIGWALEARVRARRVEAADASAELLAAEARILRVDVAAGTAEHFLASLVSQARLARARRGIALAERTVQAVRKRVRAGRTPRAELLRAESALARARLARDDVTHEQSAAYHRLAAQWGDARPGFSRVEGDLLTLPRVLPYPVLAQRLEDGPELARRSSAERLARASLRLASARRTPPLRPQLGLRRLGATDETAFVAGVSFELPVLDRRQGEIAASRASVSRARAETEAERVRLRSTLFELREELEHELHRAGTLSAEVIPRLDEAVEGARRAYEQGRYGYLDLSSLQSELLEARAELIEASAGAHRLVVALERLTGQRVLQP